MVKLLHDALDLLGVSRIEFAGLCVPSCLFALVVAYLYTKDRYRRL